MDPIYEKVPVSVRPARPEDAEAIRRIRNHAIEHLTSTWTTTPLSEQAAKAWLDNHLRDGSAFVAEVSGTVAGYASYAQWRPAEGYRNTVEDSVYVREEEHRRGVGSALLATVIEAAREAGHRIMLAGIEAENEASLALHGRFGFEPVGTIRDAGQKFGGWLDLTIMRLPLR